MIKQLCDNYWEIQKEIYKTECEVLGNLSHPLAVKEVARRDAIVEIIDSFGIYS